VPDRAPRTRAQFANPLGSVASIFPYQAGSEGSLLREENSDSLWPRVPDIVDEQIGYRAHSPTITTTAQERRGPKQLRELNRVPLKGNNPSLGYTAS